VDLRNSEGPAEEQAAPDGAAPDRTSPRSATSGISPVRIERLAELVSQLSGADPRLCRAAVEQSLDGASDDTLEVVARALAKLKLGMADAVDLREQGAGAASQPA
jgi:hypothetical protein